MQSTGCRGAILGLAQPRNTLEKKSALPQIDLDRLSINIHHLLSILSGKGMHQTVADLMVRYFQSFNHMGISTVPPPDSISIKKMQELGLVLKNPFTTDSYLKNDNTNKNLDFILSCLK